MTLNEMATTYYNLVRFSAKVEDEDRKDSIGITCGEIILKVVQEGHSTFDFFKIVDDLRKAESFLSKPETKEYMVKIVQEAEYFVILDATSEEDAVSKAEHGLTYEPHFMDNAEETGKYDFKVKGAEIA